MAGLPHTVAPVVYVHRRLFVVGPVKVDVAVWFGSWWNIGHQSVMAALTVMVKVEATIVVASKRTIIK